MTNSHHHSSKFHPCSPCRMQLVVSTSKWTSQERSSSQEDHNILARTAPLSWKLQRDINLIFPSQIYLVSIPKRKQPFIHRIMQEQQLIANILLLSHRQPCNNKYIQLLVGASLRFHNIVRFPRRKDGRICEDFDTRTIFAVDRNIVTINYKDTGIPFNFKVNYVVKGRINLRWLENENDYNILYADVNECNFRLGQHCHRCTNLQGSYRCDCDDGYYHSYSANTCYGKIISIMCKNMKLRSS